MVDRFSWLVFVVLAALVALALHLLPGSTYASPEAMDAYFGHENSPGSWTWEHGPDGSWEKEWEPFKYRLVFRGLVDGLAGLFLMFGAARDLQTYWLAFLSVSVLSHTFAIWACARFLQATGLGLAGRLGGVAAWLLLPPILLAYMLPVQTKEDFLAYGLVFLALRGILREEWGPVVVICFLGAFVRETLLVVSLVVLMGSDAPRRIKLAALMLPIAAHIGLRLALGMDGYQVFRETNLLSPALPILSLVLVFGFGWLPLAGYLARADLVAPVRRGLSPLLPVYAPGLPTRDHRLDALRHCFPYMLALLFVAHFLMGRIQEIRITCLLSPFVLLALIAMFRERSWRKSTLIVGLAGGLAAAAAIVALEVSGAMTPLRLWLNPLIGEFAHQKWWAMVYLQIILAAGLFAAHRVTRPARETARPESS